MTELGFNPLNQYATDVKQFGYYQLFALKSADYEERFRKYPHPDFLHPNQIEDFQHLARIIRTAHQNNVRLILFIPPYHAKLLEIIKGVGLWPSFENWKRALVRVVDERTRELAEPACNVDLVDFSGYNSYTMEPVPVNGDLRAQTRWYWEPGHYKAALGDVVLRRLVGGSRGFGQELTPDTVEATLARERDAAPASSQRAADNPGRAPPDARRER